MTEEPTWQGDPELGGRRKVERQKHRTTRINGQADDPFEVGEWDFGLDNELIPPRGWLLGNLLCRQFLTSIFADGAVGKTALTMVWALSLVTGRKLVGAHVFVRSPVLFICFEDGKDELRRRLTAAMLHYGISKADVEGYLFVAAINRTDAKLAVGLNGEMAAGTLGNALDRAISRRGAGAVFLDPFVKTHSVGENDNMAIDFVVEILAELAVRRDCAVCAPHHTRKGLIEPGNADTGRGAGAMKDAFRLCYTLTPMSPEEADNFGLGAKDRVSLVRLDSGKVNLTRRAADAHWFRLVSVAIGNRTEAYPNGDEVQTVESWAPPDIFAAITIPIANDILDRIEAGPYEGGRYSPAPQAVDRAVWPVVRDFCPRLNEKQAKNVIKTWRQNGVLEVRNHEDPKHRHSNPSLFVVKRPGDRWDT